MLNLKDFNILGLKIDTAANKKDITLVSGYNSYIQQIENVLKTQKGELPSDPFFGSNYFNFIFNPTKLKSFTEVDLGDYILSAIPSLSDVNVNIIYFDENKSIINVKFKTSTYLKKQNMECNIEVPIQ